MKPYIADWRKAEQYPSLGCEVADRLAWEFLRRNKHYAEHVVQMYALADNEFQGGLKKSSMSKLIGLECWPPAEPDETAIDYFARTTDKSKGKKGRIDKPCNTFINKWSLATPVAVTTEYDPRVIRFLPHKVGLKRHDDLQSKNFNLFLYPNEVAIRFRLDMRWKPQMAAAERRFIAAAEAYELALKGLKEPAPKTGQPFVDSLKKPASNGGHLSLIQCQRGFCQSSWENRDEPLEYLYRVQPFQAQACSQTSRGYLVCSPAHVRNVERKPCAVYVTLRFSRSTTLVKA